MQQRAETLMSVITMWRYEHLHGTCNHLQPTHLKGHLVISNKSKSVAQWFSIPADFRIIWGALKSGGWILVTVPGD